MTFTQRFRKFLTWAEKNWFRFTLGSFAVSRLYTFLLAPVYIRYFEEYANIWYYGFPPYLKHWYEYPPGTIPFVLAPLWADLAGLGIYRWNFRFMMLLVDILLFAIVFVVNNKLFASKKTKLFNLMFYILVTAKAKDFLYENLDMMFTLSLLLPAVAPFFFKKAQPLYTSASQWLAYWFGMSIKLVNAPLGLLYFFHNLDWKNLFSFKSFRDGVVIPGIAFLLIWTAPLLMYRSSLLVIYVYHRDRTLQVESIPSLIVRGINFATDTEQIYLSQYKSYDIKGPVSEKMLPVAQLALIISMAALGIYILLNRTKADNPIFLMKVTLIYIFSYLVTNKVFSTPYHLWYPSLLALYPYKNAKERWQVYLAAAIFLGVATTPFPNWRIGNSNLSTFMAVVFQTPTALFLFWKSYTLEVPQKLKLPVAE